VGVALYQAAKGGQSVWSEGPFDVAVSHGVFAITLGQVKPLGGKLFAGKALWLGVTIGNEPELPRRPVHAVPIALRAGTAEALSCSGCIGTAQLGNGVVSAANVGFTFAGSSAKGGAATSALDLQCSGCVSVAEMKLDGDLDLGGNALKAKKIAAAEISASAILASSFVGDGSKLTGLKVPAGSCKKVGEVVKGIAADGSLICVSGGLPPDGLEQVSNGLLTNRFVYVNASASAPTPIADNNPIGSSDTITVADRGVAQALTVQVDVSNSDISKLTLRLIDPKGAKYTLHQGGPKGTSIKTSYPDKAKPKSGDLAGWVGANPKGKWTLQAIDTAFTNNKNDGAIKAWSVTVQTLSDKQVAAKGAFQFHVAQSHPLPCEAATFGLSYANDKDKALYICSGKQWVPFPLAAPGTQDNAAASCLEILKKSPLSKDGPYWLKIGGKAVPVWCDMTTHGGGWTQLLRVTGTTFEWSSKHWTTATTLNPGKVQPAWDDAKFATFNELVVGEVLLKSKAGKFTVLKLPSSDKALLGHFKGPAKVLQYVAGAATPLELVNGQKVGTCNPPWRLNSKGSHKAWIRLGGWATKTWNCGYGNDASGSPTGAHLIGFGLRDDEWGPFKWKIKSFGIRDAHDAGHIGQTVSSGQIWGR